MRTSGLTVIFTALCVCIVMSTLIVNADTIAFPGAEGAGKFTKGGRGGDVFHVTTLEDSGTGSLREGIESIKGPRTIVFDISGMIRLKTDLEIIDKSHLTIAGQSAPGKGITLADRRLLIENCSHIIVRYLRIRLGDENKPAGTTLDCITVNYNDHIILDHLSLSWGIDGNGDFRGLKHSTLQWLIFGEALHNSLHKKGPHAMCTSFRDSQGFATLHHNIYASSRNRHPSVSGGPQVMEFCNNLDYNWTGGQNISGEQFNLINNYYKAGPSMKADNLPLQFKSKEITPISRGYFLGNYFDGLPEKYNHDNYTAMNYNATSTKRQSTTREFFEVSKRFDAGKYKLTKIESAKEAYESCLKKSGCSLMRDTVDERLIKSIINNTGKIIDSQNDVGGWDMYPSVVRPAGFDTDQDGMSDVWELAQVPALDPTDPSDRNNYDFSSDYTNLEVYINSIIGESDPPLPNPATFASVPTVAGDTSISMTATTGSDTSGPVEYYFTETTGNPGGIDSGWQTSPVYTDTELSLGTHYTYTVMMRDSILPTPNIGSASVRASATTATAPAIIAEPESSEIASGSSVMLSVTAEGDGLTYQWYEGQIGDTSNPVGT